jgi:uncharacterized membrane protein YvbJ
MYCKNCGTQIDDNQKFCPACGAPAVEQQTAQPAETQPAAANDKGGFGYGLLGFFVPLAGLILYFVWKNEKPKSAKACLTGFLVQICLNVVIGIIYGIIVGLAASSTLETSVGLLGAFLF